MTKEELSVIKQNVEACRSWMSEHFMFIYQSHVDKLITALEEAWQEREDDHENQKLRDACIGRYL